MEQITKEQALNNLIQVANQSKFTLADGDAIKQSIQILISSLQLLDSLITKNEPKEELLEEVKPEVLVN